MKKQEKASQTKTTTKKTKPSFLADNLVDNLVDSVVSKKGKNEQKQAAQDLFVYSQNSQKDIAILLNVTEATISRWKDEGKWDELRGSISLSQNEIVANILRSAAELSKQTPVNADALSKLAVSLEKFKPTKATITNYINAFQDLGNWAKKNGYLEEAQILLKIQKIFIEEKLK